MLHSDFLFFRRRNPCAILAVVWISGLLFGALISFSSGDLLSSAMRAASSAGISIFGLFMALLLPLLSTAIAVYLSRLSLLIPVVFVKAFLFSFTGIGVLRSFGSAGWLIRCLLMFSDIMILPVLWLVWLQLLTGDRRTAFRKCVAAAVCIVLIGWFDYALVAPFLTRLI